LYNHFLVPIVYFAGQVVHLARATAAGVIVTHTAHSFQSIYQTEHTECAAEIASILGTSKFVLLLGDHNLCVRGLPFGEKGRLPAQHSAQRHTWTSLTAREMVDHTEGDIGDVARHLWAAADKMTSLPEHPKPGRMLISNSLYIQSTNQSSDYKPLVTHPQLQALKKIALQCLP
jgi:hypothetical protein